MLAVVLAVAPVYWPGLHGDWGRDDYFQLAFARLLESPWPLFVHDHFPVPGSVFRPLGVASMWLGAALFGANYTAHAASDLVLHLGVCLALLALLARLGLAPLPAALATLLFGLHPAVLGTALWWSARFDLLAALFVLLAMNAACAYRERQRPRSLVIALACVLAALLSKETGLAAVAAILLAWLHWGWRVRGQRATALRAAALLCACAVLWFGWRALVLGTPSSGLTGATALVDALTQGISDWVRYAPGYFVYWERLDAYARSAGLAAIVLVIAAVAWRMRMPAPPARMAAWIGIGASLVLVPALLQAPVAALNAAPLEEGVSAVEAAMQSRLYYLGTAGLAVLCGAVLAWIWSAPSMQARALAIVALLPWLGVSALASHRVADAFALRSVEIAKVAHAAVDGVAALELPPSRCHVVLLGIEQAPEWGGYVSIDSVLKALSPEPARIAHCWFHSEDITWFHLLSAPVVTGEAAPFEPLEVNGARLPWREIGGVVIAYLQAREPADPSQTGHIRFLRWRDGRFEDARPQVLDGSVPLRIGVTPAR